MSSARKFPQEEAYFHKQNQELIEKLKEKTVASANRPNSQSPTQTGQAKVLTFDQKKRKAR